MTEAVCLSFGDGDRHDAFYHEARGRFLLHMMTRVKQYEEHHSPGAVNHPHSIVLTIDWKLYAYLSDQGIHVINLNQLHQFA